GPRDIRYAKAGDWVGARVLHTTARLSEHKEIPDPQLHVQTSLSGRLITLAGFALSTLGRSCSSDRSWTRRRQPTWPSGSGSGFAIERKLVCGPSGAIKRAAWEIDGVPAGLVQAMSSRRREVEDLRQQYRQVTGPEAEGPGWERFLQEH